MIRAERQESRALVWAAGLFTLALALRLIHLVTIRDSPFFSLLYIDPKFFDEWGQRIAAGQWFSDRPFFLDPLYPYFLGAVYTIFGHHYEPVAAIQGFLGAWVPPLLFLASRRWFDTSTAKLAGIMAAIYLPSIYFGGLMMKPGLSLVLVTIAMWLLSRALAGAGGWTWMASGVVLGLACLTRGNLILVLPFLAVWFLLRANGTSQSPARGPLERARDRRRWTEVGAFLGGAALVLALPAAHNYAVGGEWILSTANAGANFYIGNNPTNHSGEYKPLPFVHPNPKHEQRDFAREAERRSGRKLSDKETSRFWFSESWSWIRSEPWAWVRLMGRKTRSFWGAYEVPDSLDYYLYRTTAPVLRLPIPGFGLLAPLGLLGAVLSWRRRGWPRMLIVFLVTYPGTVILFFVFSRFRMVVIPALFVFAACGALELFRRWRNAVRRQDGYGPAVTATVLFLGFSVFVNLPVRAMAYTWSFRIATASGLPTRLETSAIGHLNLGVAYAALAKESENPDELLVLAETQLRESLRLNPPFAKVHVELGKVLARQQRNREAIDVYREGATIEPNDPLIHHALGRLHQRLSELDAAEAAFRKALSIVPQHTPSATRLGDVLLEQGRPAEAAEAFRHALRYAPGDLKAQEGLRRATKSGG